MNMTCFTSGVEVSDLNLFSQQKDKYISQIKEVSPGYASVRFVLRTTEDSEIIYIRAGNVLSNKVQVSVSAGSLQKITILPVEQDGTLLSEMDVTKPYQAKV